MQNLYEVTAMSTIFLNNHVDDGDPCHCDNCDWDGIAVQVDPITDVEQRLTPGETVPVGQCPECGALAYVNGA